MYMKKAKQDLYYEFTGKEVLLKYGNKIIRRKQASNYHEAKMVIEKMEPRLFSRIKA